MKKVFTVLLLFVVPNLQAQTDNFNTFRNRMLSDYKDYRKGMMERYAEFLDAAWAEYETMTGRRRVTTPKPTIAPVYIPSKNPIAEEPKKPVVVEPQTPVNPASTQPTLPKAPTQPTTPKVPATPKVPSAPKVPQTPSNPSTPQIKFTLYGLSMAVPAPKLDATLKASSQQEAVELWKQIHASDTKSCVEGLQQLSSTYRLGDWCTFKAVEKYCTVWAKGNVGAARVMMQYLMLNMGYDVRMSVAGNDVYLMLPFKQKVYSNTYIPMGKTNYYVYPNSMPANSRIYSCALPEGEDCGRQMDLIVNPAYRLPRNNQSFEFSYGGLSVHGDVNKNVIALQQEYPSMDIYCYAASMTDAEVRNAVVGQLKEQLKGVGEAESANALLHFVQSAFKYQTDGQQFGEGVEKSFFFDETLYFPYCDCEDRSIFYAYLVREILGLDVLLVGYPGHECTAVALSEAPDNATGFIYRNRTYYICDPTYIGADIGVCMPDYEDLVPEVEEWY